MLVNFLVLLLWIPSLLGWGGASRAILASGLGKSEAIADSNPGVIMMLGLGPLAIISTFLHFFVPLGSGISVAILSVGYLLLLLHLRTLRPAFSACSIAGAFPVMLIVSLFASRPLWHFDTGLYHVQAVKWCTTLPLVRGLANLHERLAFTSVWTPLSAVVDFPRFTHSACFPVTTLLLFAFGWAACVAVLGLKNNAHRVEDVFLAGCGCFWMWMVVSDSALIILPSLSTDAPVYFTTLLCVYLFLRFCFRREHVDLFQALTVAALALTSKFSAAPLFLCLVIFGAFTWWRDTRSFSSKTRALIPIALTTGLLLAVWMARSVYLSGYLIFPLRSTALTFLPWHLPAPMAAQLVETLQAWARQPGLAPELVLANSNWIVGWVIRFFDEEIFYTVIAYAIFGAAMIFAARRTGRIKEVIAKSGAPVTMLTIGTLYWLLTAPDPRYGYAYLFALACLAFAVGIVSLLSEKAKLVRVALAGAGLIPLLTVTNISHFHFRDLPRLGVGPNLVAKTNQGIPIYVAKGDQRVFDAPLPSTPYFRPTLLARLNAQGQIREFDLPEAVFTPYYGIVPLEVRNGLRHR